MTYEVVAYCDECDWATDWEPWTGDALTRANKAAERHTKTAQHPTHTTARRA